MIAAAGSGERLGAGGPKAFVPLAGAPLLEHSLVAVEASGAIADVVVAAPAGHEPETEQLLSGRGALAGTVVTGGATRADSVRAALERVEAEFVVVHDAARPLAGAALFDAIVARLERDPDADAVIAAAPLLDTVKRSLHAHGSGPETVAGEVAETVPRERLWAAQTPQGFRSVELRAAQERARSAGELERATDEARLLELAGGRVVLEPASPYNLKVTGPEDLRVAEALLTDLGRV